MSKSKPVDLKGVHEAAEKKHSSNDPLEVEVGLLIDHGFVEEKNRANTIALLRAREELRKLKFTTVTSDFSHLIHGKMQAIQEAVHLREYLQTVLEPLKHGKSCKESITKLGGTLSEINTALTALKQCVEQACVSERHVQYLLQQYTEEIHKLRATVGAE